MRLRQIEIFYHVYKEGSISGAARELHVSQPSVSKTLRYAEDQLGFALFRRVKGKLFPTPAADELFADVKHIYGQVGALNRSAYNIRNRKGGHIRLGVLPSLSLTIVPECIAILRQKNPDLSFEITTLHSEEMNAALLERRCDLCLGFGTTPHDKIESRHLAAADLILIAKPEHFSGEFDAASDSVDLSILNAADFIGIKDSGPAGEILTQQLDKRGITPNVVVTVHTYYVASSLVRLGVGMSVVDKFTASSFMADDLVKLHFSEPVFHPVCAASHMDNGQPELIAQCLDTFEEIIRR